MVRSLLCFQRAGYNLNEWEKQQPKTMAQIRLLFWNIQTYGKKKAETSANNQQLVDYIAKLIHYEQANIFVILELYYSVAAQVANRIVAVITKLQQLNDKNTPWKARVIKAGGSEAYVVLYRVDQEFWPARTN